MTKLSDFLDFPIGVDEVKDAGGRMVVTIKGLKVKSFRKGEESLYLSFAEGGTLRLNMTRARALMQAFKLRPSDDRLESLIGKKIELFIDPQSKQWGGGLGDGVAISPKPPAVNGASKPAQSAGDSDGKALAIAARDEFFAQTAKRFGLTVDEIIASLKLAGIMFAATDERKAIITDHIETYAMEKAAQAGE